MMPVSQVPRILAIIARVAMGKTSGPDELVLKRRDGSVITIEVRTYPLKIKDKLLVLGSAGISRNGKK